ncbi:RNA 2',3'-cyclic phosphodiesterase [Oceaniglobus roseus]|uniref:RNA 2',3'-cyclic phosphodiesterase n=1 Tax=Oceaniglobus roseus TaxID=1737570 RepID=UPI000C7F6E03|nr:RNA 2',3'-cyclic phosphodiesterase [Kandeliimicrobium roseum]
MRAFLALDLPDDPADQAERLQSRLTVGRHVPADDLHLTMVFLGDATAEQLEELHQRVEMMAWPPLSLRIAGADVFGGAQPRALFLRVDPDPVLTGFQKKLETFARQAGIALPHRRFVPHVTLARFNPPLGEVEAAKIGRFLQAHGDWTLPPFAPEALTLYRSHLRPEGPLYEVLSRYGPLPMAY